jgi:predicted ATPase/DNA-binding CsgD family transcriptional regulator
MSIGNSSENVLQADELTWREQEVLILLADRRTNREIAAQLHLAESTVKDYVGRILSKLYVKNRRQAVKKAQALGLLDRERKTSAKPPTNLPAETTPFIGRREELGEITLRLQETRLLTLTGPGGIGKTRLAIKAAEGGIDDFADGVFFVSLAPINSVEHIIQTIAEAVKCPLATQAEPQQQLLRYLRRKQLLIVMDNFEHLLDGSYILNAILQAAPSVRIIATSRERLNLQSETALYIAGMTFPDPVGAEDSHTYDAITLFTQSAQKVSPGYTPTKDEIEQIANVCHLVQGMPLAIELAAAWLQILSVNDILKELEKGLDILSSDMRDAPERHRSIHAVFDSSWTWLDQTEKRIFTLLSIFRGGFTRHAAQQVSGASLQELVTLANKSFLSHDPDSGRLEIHELLRQYAHEKLKADAQLSLTTQESHAAYFAEFMHQRWQHLKDRRQMKALDEIESDIENVRVAWRYYQDQANAKQMWNFVYTFWLVYWIRGWHLGGMELFAEAVEVLVAKQSEESRAVRAISMSFQAYFMCWLGLSNQGYEISKESVATLEHLNYPEALIFAYNSWEVNAYFLQRYDEEYEASKKMLAVARDTKDKWSIAFSLFASSLGALLLQKYPKAKQLAESSLKINEENGDVVGSIMSSIVLGHLSYVEGGFEEAIVIYQRCLDLSMETGFNYGLQTSSKYLGKGTLSMGNITEARLYLLQCLMITNEVGFVRDLINLISEFARLQIAEGDPEQASELLAFVLQHPASNSSRMLEGRIRDSAKEMLDDLEAELSPEIFTAAQKRGQELELDEIVSELISRYS